MKLLILVLLLFPLPLLAQEHDARARRILERPEYQGYRIERDQPGRIDEIGDAEGTESERPGDDRSLRRESEVGPGGPSEGGSGRSGSGPSGASWIGEVLQVVMWIVVIGAAAIALYFIVKALIGMRFKRRPKPEKSKATKAAPDDTDAPAAEAAPLPEFADALALARRDYEAAIAAGDWARAALLAYRIFWLQAGWRGCVEDSDVRTWRDALRMVRHAELRQRMRELLGLIERVRYGEHVPAKPEYESWKARLDDIEPGEALR